MSRILDIQDKQMTMEDLALINELAHKELKEEEVYIFSVRLCDNEIDREWERFPRETLEELALMLVGKIGVFDHNWSSQGQAARIYKTQVVDEEGRLTRAGDPACYLKGWAYMLRTKGNAELIAQIDGGIKKEVSVGCAVGRSVCSVCGEEMGSCQHMKGRTYNGKLCWTELKGAVDAYEWSFVEVPVFRTYAEEQSNDPLTLEELMKMDGQPVYLAEDRKWYIVSVNYETNQFKQPCGVDKWGAGTSLRLLARCGVYRCPPKNA